MSKAEGMDINEINATLHTSSSEGFSLSEGLEKNNSLLLTGLGSNSPYSREDISRKHVEPSVDFVESEVHLNKTLVMSQLVTCEGEVNNSLQFTGSRENTQTCGSEFLQNINSRDKICASPCTEAIVTTQSTNRVCPADEDDSASESLLCEVTGGVEILSDRSDGSDSGLGSDLVEDRTVVSTVDSFSSSSSVDESCCVAIENEDGIVSDSEVLFMGGITDDIEIKHSLDVEIESSSHIKIETTKNVKLPCDNLQTSLSQAFCKLESPLNIFSNTAEFSKTNSSSFEIKSESFVEASPNFFELPNITANSLGFPSDIEMGTRLSALTTTNSEEESIKECSIVSITEDVVTSSAVENIMPTLVKSNLKRNYYFDDPETPKLKKKKRSISFDKVTVYYFPRSQGFTCVPSQGGSTLGMAPQHAHVQQFSLLEHAVEQRRLHRQVLLQLRNERLSAQRTASSSDDSESEEEQSDVSESELDLDSYYFLQGKLSTLKGCKSTLMGYTMVQLTRQGHGAIGQGKSKKYKEVEEWESAVKIFTEIQKDHNSSNKEIANAITRLASAQEELLGQQMSVATALETAVAAHLESNKLQAEANRLQAESNRVQQAHNNKITELLTEFLLDRAH